MTVQVAPQAVGQTGVGFQDGQHVLVQYPRAQDAHRRNLHRFLPAFGGSRVVVARHRAAHVVPMRGRSQKAEQLCAPEHRTHQLEVIRVRAAFVGVVEEPDVAIHHATALGGHLGGRLHGKGHRAHKDRQAGFALDQGGAGGRVVHAVAGVVGLGNDGVERAAVQRRVHLIGNLFQTALQDRQGDGIKHRVLPKRFDAVSADSAVRRPAPCP
ncbi:hypothetical protein D3C73_1145510 [compost metagenome]